MAKRLGKVLGDSIVRTIVSLPVVQRRVLLVLWDSLSWFLAIFLITLARFDLSLSQEHWSSLIAYTVAAIGLQVVGGLLTHAYLGRSRVGSYAEATLLGSLVLGVALVLGAIFVPFDPAFPRSAAVLVPVVALLAMAAGRWAFRLFYSMRYLGTVEDAPRVLVYGAGDSGHQLADLVAITDPSPYNIVGFIDDDPGKRFRRVRGHRVLGTGNMLREQLIAAEAEKVILAISEASPDLLKRVSRECDEMGVKLIVIPPVKEMISGRIELGALREFNVTDLLGRRPIETDLSQISGYVTDKVVLITGAGGSIGSELARQVFRLGPRKLILLDRDESELHGVQLSLYGSGLLDTDDMVLCDIRDEDALWAVFEKHRPEVVFHAAALKHLPMLERFPMEGWKTNVLGTYKVLRCAHEAGVGRFVNISTDKAADATSVLGQTKRLAERLTAWYAAAHDLPYVSVRFGNVLGSRGSVLYTFRAQIERGGPITVTHPDVTRYFMTIPEACQLVLQAAVIGRPGDVLVLDMGEPVKIVDVAERLIAESGKEIEIEFTGLRPGEKLHEVLFSSYEEGAVSDHPLISQVSVPEVHPADLLIESRLEDVAQLLSEQKNQNLQGASA